jgi:hypothetical protein
MGVTKQEKITTRNKDRMNFRPDPEIKERLARAAAITGQELTDFAVPDPEREGGRGLGAAREPTAHE